MGIMFTLMGAALALMLTVWDCDRNSTDTATGNAQNLDKGKKSPSAI